ncbi:MAG: hypothetical protein ACPG4Z_01040 [Chitinophagales bacterium]
MKKLLILCITFISVYSTTIAQKDKKEYINEKSKHEIGVNATFFVKQFFNFSNTTLEISPYAFSYKFISKNNHAFRTGIGMDFRALNDPAEEDDDLDIKNSSINLDWRVGYEKQVAISKKFIFTGGVDFVNDMRIQTVKSTQNLFVGPIGPPLESEVKTTNSEIGFGVGPVIGFQVNFTDRIGLYTESALIMKQTMIKNETKVSEAPDLDTKDKSSEIRMDFVLPTSLYFAIRF